MARKDNENNPLQIKLRVDSLPKSVTPKKFYRRLIDVVAGRAEMPSSWIVNVAWRNPKTKHGETKRWQEGDFETVVSDSADRGGFNQILQDALVRRLRRFQ